VPWLLIALGAGLLWAGWDALRHLGSVRPLTDREVDRAVLGEGSRPLSEAGQAWFRRRLPAHNSLERLLACTFILAGAACVAGGALLLWASWR
jgi:hypothetical protein